MGYVWSMNRGWSCVIRCDHGKGKNKDKLFEFVYSVGNTSACLKDTFLLWIFLLLSVLPPERTQLAMFWLE